MVTSNTFSVTVGNNNPDSYPAATLTQTSRDYETEVAAEMVDPTATTVAYSDYFPTGGYSGTGAWRTYAINGVDDSLQDNRGWDSGLNGGDWAVDTSNLLTISYMLYVSSAFMADLADTAANTNTFWQAGGKIIDVAMWDAAGTGRDSNTRQVIKFWPTGTDGFWGEPTFPDTEGVWFSHLNGGAGSEFVGDNENTYGTQTDFQTITDEWVWVCHVFDAVDADDANKWTRTYMKRSGDSGVTKILEKRGDYNTAPHIAQAWTSRGWYNARSVWGYWDEIYGATDSTSKYISLDRLRVANGWIDPPF